MWRNCSSFRYYMLLSNLFSAMVVALSIQIPNNWPQQRNFPSKNKILESLEIFLPSMNIGNIPRYWPSELKYFYLSWCWNIFQTVLLMPELCPAYTTTLGSRCLLPIYWWNKHNNKTSHGISSPPITDQSHVTWRALDQSERRAEYGDNKWKPQ